MTETEAASLSQKLVDLRREYANVNFGVLFGDKYTRREAQVDDLQLRIASVRDRLYNARFRFVNEIWAKVN